MVQSSRAVFGAGSRRSRGVLLAGLASVALSGLAACQSGPHAWYRVDDFPGAASWTSHPLLDFEYESSIEKPKGKKTGAPPRMVRFDDELQVQCVYCHVDGDPRNGDLTPEGTWSRVDMDISDRFKVDCAYCHDQSPRKFTKAGKFADRDYHIPERRWKCASCHDVGFKVTRRS